MIGPAKLHTVTLHRALRLAVAALGLALAGAPAVADDLIDPPSYYADVRTHVLSLLLIAKPMPLSLPGGYNTTAWVYEVCPRPAGDQPNACPAGTSVQPLGGPRLALKRGDTLKIRLVNQLPVVTDSKHCGEPNHADLVNNPTNLHTHGLIVEPHRAEGPSDTYGDYVFLEIHNRANHGTCQAANNAANIAAKAAATASFAPETLPFGKICSSRPGALHPDMDVLDNAAEYSITIPPTHPSGLYWFHPHMHGISMNQITSGMAGVITVGHPVDMCADAACRPIVANTPKQFVVLKDMQVEANGTLDDQQDAGFCSGTVEADVVSRRKFAVEAISQPKEVAGDQPPVGGCPGASTHFHGRWFHTVNGQVYPTIPVGGDGSIWRIVNASASRSYRLSLNSGTDTSPIPLQILAVDGVTIQTGSTAALQQALGPQAQVVACGANAGSSVGGVCVLSFDMMPASRIEVRVTNPGSSQLGAILETAFYPTGPSGDLWPKIYLANVSLAPPTPMSRQPLDLAGANEVMSPSGALGVPATLQVPGTSQTVTPEQLRAMHAVAMGPVLQSGLRQAPSLAIDPALRAGARKEASCAPLAPGHRRRIYFGYVPPTLFGLGYVELDENGKDVPGTARNVDRYDPNNTIVCVPLAAGNKPVKEIWELVNLTGEDHNFHIHQTKFKLISQQMLGGTTGTRDNEAFLLHDGIPVLQGSAGCDGTLATALAAGTSCRTTRTVVEIPFEEIGDFVYHCHILEHEDGGMMAKIRVVPYAAAP